uniref:Uncharacterized protein n=1 Tax=viral metagenome TaxID=1070528 RepID=A0A6M3IYW4_9ZZZZ
MKSKSLFQLIMELNQISEKYTLKEWKKIMVCADSASSLLLILESGIIERISLEEKEK